MTHEERMTKAIEFNKKQKETESKVETLVQEKEANKAKEVKG